ncbi:MAG: DUF1287 domain-containing protein [Pseudopedobacter saltans]|uniref:DUF1287 domain-containing protein n=1 Tax=Pseudopedobacter saltans TaxID=151895 RepID=A0A2W5G2E5_9SPHI|nr:MAG: DUF1287 domain-containing protein [Pseudopedobacter saltans]
MRKVFWIATLVTLFCSCHQVDATNNALSQVPIKKVVFNNDFYFKLADAAIQLTHQQVTYDPDYVSIPYPNGDVAANKGVCADVIIRAYRLLGIDLQKEVHEDMVAHFSQYPNIYGLKKTDTNIDHRRVPNLMKFFQRKGKSKKLSTDPADYQYGDIVCWDLGKQSHIGIVIDEKSSDGKRPLIVHNIGGGQVIADALFAYPIIGHYRYEKINL